MKRLVLLLTSNKKNIVPALFCFVTSLLVLVTILSAMGEQRRMAGPAATFSSYAKRFSVMQADSGQIFCYEDLASFLSEYDTEVLHLLRTDLFGAELYSKGDAAWSILMDSPENALLREDLQASFASDGKVFYKNSYYTLSGLYPDTKYSDKMIVNMEGVMLHLPAAAIKGVFYADCAGETELFCEELVQKIMKKNPYANVLVDAGTIQDSLIQMTFQMETSGYYVVVIALLILLSLFNFGNLAHFWTEASTREIYIRSLCGGKKAAVFGKLMCDFLTVSGAGHLLGILAGTVLAGFFGWSFMNGGPVACLLIVLLWSGFGVITAVFLFKRILISPAIIGRLGK